jgi:hypothetical protein
MVTIGFSEDAAARSVAVSAPAKVRWENPHFCGEK